MAISEYMQQDIKQGLGGAFSWATASWALVASLSIAVEERDELRREVKKLRRSSKKGDA
jgi:hypothetical protein